METKKDIKEIRQRAELLEQDLTQAVRNYYVPKGEALAYHKEQQLEQAFDTLQSIAKDLEACL